MKKNTVLLSLIVLVAVIVTSCGKPKQTLHIYNWGDYMASSVIEQFEKEFNCIVKLDVFDSNEAMYAKLKAGAGGYDILVPSSYMAKVMFDQKMIQPLDKQLLPNVQQYFNMSYSALTLDSDLQYTVPYFVSITGIGYDVTKVNDFKPSWRMFEREDLAKRCCLLDDVREVFGCALCTLGYDVNSTNPQEIDEAIALIKTWKKNIAKFEVDDAKRALATGEFHLIQNYSGDMVQVSMENPNIRFVIPEEGTTVTFDCFAISSASQNVKLAHDFINFLYRPEIAAENMNEIGYVMPHVEGVKLVCEEMRNNPVFQLSPNDNCRPLKDLGENNALYTRGWDHIREE